MGSDVRVTPSPISALEHPPAVRREAPGPGIQAVTPVVYGLLNTLVQSEVNEDAGNMAAIDPSAFGQVAPLIDTDFVGTTAANAMDALERQPGGVLLEIEFADLLDVGLATRYRCFSHEQPQNQKLSEMNVIGIFQRLPGERARSGQHRTPDAAHPVDQRHLLPGPDHRSQRCHLGSRRRRVAAGRVRRTLCKIDTRATALDKDQSSLAALNIRGLLALDSAYALAMAATAITIFVFDLLLQRRDAIAACPGHADREDPVAAGHRILASLSSERPSGHSSAP